jgi:chromosome segregation ATPase
MLKAAGKRSGVMFGLFGVMLAAGGAALWAQPSSRPTVDASMTSLVAEVRALREAVERSSLITAQSQLVLGRLQLQEGRLATLGRQVTEARQRLNQAIRAEGDHAREVDRLTQAAERAASQEARDEAAAVLPSLRRQLKELQAQTAQGRADEQAASGALAEEQNRWVDFNSRLEALERTISSAAAMRVPR